jgi:hypothetical protein
MVIRDMNGPLGVIVEVLRVHDHGSQKIETTKEPKVKSPAIYPGVRGSFVKTRINGSLILKYFKRTEINGSL